MRCCARFRRAPATIFIARVIFCVLLTLEIRLRMAFRLGIARPRKGSLLFARYESVGELLERALQSLGDVLGELPLVANLLQKLGVFVVEEAVKLLLVFSQRLDRQLVDEAVGA